MKKTLAILALLLYACCLPTHPATLNPSASKAYVDKKFADLRAELRKNGVFTNTLQEIVNVYTNTYSGVTFKTNITYDVKSVTTNYYSYYNTYTNTYQTNNNYFVYNITTNTYHSDFTTNYHYNVTYKTNTTVNVYDTTNIVTEIHNATNLYLWVSNTVNVVTNDIVFTNTVSYTNMPFSVEGYTGVVIRASYDDTEGVYYDFTTNPVTFFPSRELANCYTNAEYALVYQSGVDESGFTYERYMLSQESAPFPHFTPNDEWEYLGLTNSYQGASLASATSMTLLYSRDGMFTSDAYLLRRVSVSEEHRDVRQIRYNPTMAAQFSLEARRLVSEDGLQWLDSTGTWWQVSDKYECHSYILQGETLMPLNEGITDGLVGEFESETWNIRCFDYGEGQQPRYRYYLFKNDGSSSQIEYDSDDPYPAKELIFNAIVGESLFALYATSVTNGLLRTNAVRRVLFDDGNALTRFDDTSVSTNEHGALQIAGFSKAADSTVPMRMSLNNGPQVVWTSVSELGSMISTDLSRNSTWGFDENSRTLYNCYVQVGNKVMAVGDGTSSSIYVQRYPDGAYGVGIMESGGDLFPYFESMSVLTGSTNTTVSVFVGNLYTEDGRRRWSGVSNIPLIMIYE